MQKDFKKLFLASNSADGFVSYFKESYDINDGWRAFIIKGGPGTGKSTIMKTVAQSAKAAGCDPILVFCSSDPDSLDGVIINEQKAVVLDGTAPHVVEPKLFGACEITVNPGDCLDTDYLRENFIQISELTDKNGFYHKTAARYIAAAGQIKNDNIRLAYSCLDAKKVRTFAEKIGKKYFTKKAGKGKNFNCFLSAVTSKGVINFTETAKLWCDKFIIIEDKYRAASNEIMRCLFAAAISRGYNVISLKDPLFAQTTEHLIIPEIGLGILCENDGIRFDIDARRIRSRRFYKAEEKAKIKNRMRYNDKVYKELLLCAANNMKTAKSVHDEIEEYYKAAMDFSGNEPIIQKLLKSIFHIKKQ